MKSILSVVVAASIISAAPAFSQTPASTTAPVRRHEDAPAAVAARRNGPLNIDGKIDEAAWQAAKPVTDFTQYDPHEGQPVSERTEARILIDDDAVYVAMRLYDSEPSKIQKQLARR